jgi:hypothetical protein
MESEDAMINLLDMIGRILANAGRVKEAQGQPLTLNEVDAIACQMERDGSTPEEVSQEQQRLLALGRNPEAKS